MIINKHNTQCPNCGTSISIDDVLTQQIEGEVKNRLEKEQLIKAETLLKKENELKKMADTLAENKKNIDAVIAEKVANKLSTEAIQLVQDTRAEAEKEQSQRVALLEDQLKSKTEKLAEATKNELDLRKEKSKLDEEKRAFELEQLKKLEEITQEAKRKAAEEQKSILAELRKQLNDVRNAKDDLARKLDQGSQKTQGEVLELELEAILREEFPYDDVEPVPTGTKGADIIQKVRDRMGRLCGQIIWETKKTKSWSEQWVQKLKEDQRAIKADFAVIVSAALPDEVKGFMFRDGVLICAINLITPLATVLRSNLESITRERSMSIGKNEKMEVLYGYLTGVEFTQRVEAILEAFHEMDEGLKKERQIYERYWALREKQLKKLRINTSGMHGDLSGLVSLPQIKSLELESLIEEIEDGDVTLA